MSNPSMPSRPVEVRDAEGHDLLRVAEIFADVVTRTHYSFVLEPPDVDHWKGKLADLDGRDGFLVAASAASGIVQGFAYSGPFRPRPAYDRTRETTIYLAPDARGQGTGVALYTALLNRLETLGNRLAIGIVAEPNPASEALHRRLGFERAGTLPDVGEKFGRLWSTTSWVRRLS